MKKCYLCGEKKKLGGVVHIPITVMKGNEQETIVDLDICEDCAKTLDGMTLARGSQNSMLKRLAIAHASSHPSPCSDVMK